jgi:uncharacterized C2H2 Zn-finger protein
MSLFKCPKCSKIFNRKLHFDNHVNRKTTCVKPQDIITNTNLETDLSTELNEIITETNSKTSFTCKYCQKTYCRNDSLVRHIKQNTCKVKKELNDVYLTEIELLKKKLADHSNKINELNVERNTNIVSNSNNTINTVNNNVTNQFNIVSIGKEDMSKLTQEELLKIATSGVFYPLVAADIIHCNQRLPDFQNILISNLRSNKGSVYSIGNWMTKDQDDIIRQIMDVDKMHVSNIIKDIKVDDEKIKNKIEYTKDELKENKSHQLDKVRNIFHSASKMINKNKNKKNVKKEEPLIKDE